MATSNSTNYNNTRNEIIKDSLIEINALGAEDTVESADQALANRHLNRMIKAWNADGINLWRHQEATVYLRTGEESNTLSSSSSGEGSNSTVETTFSADEAAAQTVISVTSSTGMTAADIILLELNDTTYEDTTIVSVDSATQITITDALTSAASSGNVIYTFTTRMGRPLSIENVRLRNKDGTDTQVWELNRDDYFAIPNKDTESTPNSYYYDPQRDAGVLYLWPTTDSLRNKLKITYSRSVEDFDAAGDTPDFPQEWLEALVLGLAARLARAFGRDQKLIGSLKAEAEVAFQRAKSWDTERAPLQILPETRF